MCSSQVGSGTIVYLTCGDFGEFVDDKKVKQRIKVFTWTSTSKVEVKIINYGGYIISIKAPDRKLNVHDIVIGFDKLEGYLSKENAYLGCTVGRVANRIANGRMVIEGKEYKLCTNNGPNHLHGGSIGFDKVVWDYSVQENKVILSYVSPDMEEGYPGTLLVNVSFELNTENEFIINYKAMTSKPTIVNLTNHSYFNLAGDHTGAEEIYNHLVLINAKKITEIDDNLIPTGKYTPVDGTVFDFQTSKVLRDVIKNVPASPGFDHNFCLETCGGCNKIAARVKHHCSGRVLEVYTDQPGIQFYTGNFLPEKDTLKGKNGFIKKHGAFCLETQNYPDAVNQPLFPSPLLYPGDTYNTTTIFKFVVE